MFSFLRKNNEKTPASPPAEEKKGLLASLTSRLGKTRDNLTAGLADLFLGKKTIDDDILEELETRLLMADVGVDATSKIIADLTSRVSRKELSDADALFEALVENLNGLLEGCDAPLEIRKPENGPFVILVTGINGAGKTTSIGKLARHFQDQGYSVMLAAGDTFRAAATEQLQTWGERNNIPVIAQGDGADPASVIFDAMQSAKARGIDILLADTAGRLHTQTNLMEELKKVKRVIQKNDPTAPHETLLVLDSGIGQNAINQAEQFNNAIGVSGIVMTKLDGTAKGGILFALAGKLKIPFRYIGVGESIADLRPFHRQEFVDALLGHTKED